MSKRILVAGLYHETNTFLPERTSLSEFSVREEADLLTAAGDGSPLGYALEEMRARDLTAVPVIDLRATPSGTVDDAVVERFLSAVAPVAANGGPIDGILLVLHGAMVAESFPDVEGEILERLRAMPDMDIVPLIAVLDLHANVTDRMALYTDAFAVYRENPHTDAGETGRRAVRLLDDLVRHGKRGKTLCARPAIVWPPTGTATAADPMRTLEAMARAAEAGDPSLSEVGVLAGFSFADLREAGVGFTISFTLGDSQAEERARSVLQRLSAAAWERRAIGNVVGISLSDAVARAKAHADSGAPGGPLVIAEAADNIGAGAPGDLTGLLRAFLDSGVEGAATTLNDPEAVAALGDGVEIGETHRRTIGGKRGGIGGEPLVVDVTLLGRSDGRFTLEDRNSHQASLNGVNVNMGSSALVRCTTVGNAEGPGSNGVVVLLTSRKTPPFDLGQWRSQGIDPEDFSVIGVKAAVAHRRAYDPIAGQSLTVETPGPCASDLKTLPYRRLRRPVFPLDEEAILFR